MSCELLAGFRLLDLSDDRGALCGRIFADLGADVIKIEPPMGCVTRRIPPFLDDLPGPQRSLYFLAYEAGKRSVTLNLDSADGRRLLGELARHADFVVESFAPGYLATRSVDYEQLAATNPRLIQVTITPFGDRGPGTQFAATDLTVWAAGGMMYMMGEAGRPPLQMSLPQAGLHAGAEAAVAALIAHYARQRSGIGQRVVINMQACVVGTLMNEQAMPIMHGNWIRRSGAWSAALGLQQRLIYRCADGHVAVLIIGAAGAPSTRALIQWMDEQGQAAPWMNSMAWETWAPGMLMAASAEELAQVRELDQAVQAFLLPMTRAEIYRQGLRRRILLAPVNSVADIARDPQLAARQFFVPMAAPPGLPTLTVPGPFARLSQTPLTPTQPPPALGEHNQAVYGELLGLSRDDLSRLHAAGAI
ncbi:MAG TPA: CaiB/BaiF CoA-transferase family protein [Candidatus Binataceae bacterium]|nr:CaiB/BaiF CoA-transferase family protein [Candidatus Binataceae bacterium]